MNYLLNHKFEESIIEYIDADEQNNSLIAMKPRELNKIEKKYLLQIIHTVKFIQALYLEF